MSHKVEINTEEGSIKIDGLEIGETVANWSFSFSQGNMQATNGRSAYAMVFQRFVYDGDKILSDDSGIMVYTQIFNDVEVFIKVDGKMRQVVAPPPGMKVKPFKPGHN